MSLVAAKNTKKKTVGVKAPAVEEPRVEIAETGMPKWREAEMGEDKLDPAEEKMLDRILNGVVIFILGWLGLSVLLVIGGYFGMWK